MSLPKFEYHSAKTLEEAGELALKLGPGCRLMAGGTDIIAAMKDRVDKPAFILDLTRIPGMDRIVYKPGEGLKIGALVKLRDIETSAEIKKQNPAVAAAAHYVASTQVRHKGTMAGNICNASPSADTAPILLALEARVTAFKDGKNRVIPIGEFFKGVKKTNLEQGEIVTEIAIPDLQAGEGAAYFKHAVRKAMDLAIIGVAAWVKMDGKKVVDCRIAVGGAATTPVRVPEAEALLKGREITPELLEQAGVAASQGVKPISDIRASAEYRTDMVRVFTKRAINQALEDLKQ
jgi:carbon-monoxide dehydrogenase medium subunit